MSRRIAPEFQEVLAASLLVFLPHHRDHSLSQRQARRRLEKAIDLPRGMMEAWPAACCNLVIKAQLTIDDMPGGIDKAAIEAATDAKWPAATGRQAWQRRRDIGDLDDELAA